MAKAEKRRRATTFPKQVSIAVEAASDKKANDLVVLLETGRAVETPRGRAGPNRSPVQRSGRWTAST